MGVEIGAHRYKQSEQDNSWEKAISSLKRNIAIDKLQSKKTKDPRQAQAITLPFCEYCGTRRLAPSRGALSFTNCGIKE
jgi:hypothetical protein